MNRHDRDCTKLIVDTFHDDWVGGRAASWAGVAARHARRRRTGRRALAVGGALLLVVAGVSFLTRPAPSPARPATASTPSPRGYEIISDDELISGLKDRPLLVVTKANGSRELIVLSAAPPGPKDPC